jgi:hypothetical protein
MSRENSRKAAVDATRKDGNALELDPDAQGAGLRDWFDGLSELRTNAAAFDTRLDAPAVFTGRASKGIAKRLRGHGSTLVVEPMSFLVTKQSQLIDDEATHAREWGAQIRQALTAD